jgi:hypothetical protein
VAKRSAQRRGLRKKRYVDRSTLDCQFLKKHLILGGHYEELSGQNIEVNVYDKGTCPSNVETVGVVDCTPVYLARKRDRGDVDSRKDIRLDVL